MKNKNITDIFAEKKKVNIGYIVAGYPNIAFTQEFLSKLDDSAIDMLEIGIPYSDPLADGKHIAEASFAASQAGVTTDVVFNLLNSVKGKVHKPLIFLVYYNLVFAYGLENFVKKSAEAGIKGMIIPDLPYEEATEVARLLNAYNIAFIPLVSVTSGNRIPNIASLAQDGFVYAVGSLGVTGSKQVDLGRLEQFITQIRQYTSLPIALGFGIKTNIDVQTMRRYADGVIVGTSIVILTQSNDVTSTMQAIEKLFAY